MTNLLTYLNSSLAVCAAVTGCSLALFSPSTAEACGGCFVPPDAVTVVTAHRMAVALGEEETTLWDQIQYGGEAEDFVWVLPIQGEQLVELSDNAFFQALNTQTRVSLRASFPALQVACGGGGSGFGCGSSDFAASSGGEPVPPQSPVEIFGTAVVGPYETATIGSEDPSALVTWLQDNGYGVPDSILPTIKHYTDAGMNFAVLRLRPDASVTQMQPVRVTTPGLMPVFPLRMVAAGVPESVELDLYIFAEGRYESSNFPSVEVDQAELEFDWDTSTYNYEETFAAAVAENGGRTWVVEYAQPWEQYSFIRNGGVSNEDGTTASVMEDFDIVTRAVERPYLTRLRTDMKASNLIEDLVLAANLSGGDVENALAVEGQVNRPPPVDCSGGLNPAGQTGPWGDLGMMAFGLLVLSIRRFRV